MLVVWIISAFLLEAGAKQEPREEYAEYWIKSGQERLRFEIQRQKEGAKLREKVAKNVILFLGDGMGMSTITAARIYKNQRAGGYGEEKELSFEEFPYIGLSKTYEVNSQVPDSAGTSTAILSGVKINSQVAGFDARAKLDECDPVINEKAKLENIITWAQAAGKDTGFVTTTRVTHATLASVYAHINDRYWECDSKVPQRCKDIVKDVARQLVEDEPGRNLKVVLGGGLNQLGVPVPQVDFCTRDDKQNLVEKWKQGKENCLFVNTTQDLMNADLNQVEYLMGLFSPDHMPFGLERDTSPAGQPSLVNMTEQALKLLSKNPKGYLLFVEGGNIDNAHHEGYARHALHETSDLDDAVIHAVQVANPDDTLIIVTADHSHTLTFAAFPERGADIVGTGSVLPQLYGYDFLSYANGPGFAAHKSSNCSEGYWRTVSDEERQDLRYRPFAGRHSDKETHAGEDVPVFSRGPHANLLSGVFEQNYIAHAICYAACIGPHATYCDVNKHPKFNDVTNFEGIFYPQELYVFAIVLPLLLEITFSVI
jgi:alkaline phosphatase